MNKSTSKPNAIADRKPDLEYSSLICVAKQANTCYNNAYKHLSYSPLTNAQSSNIQCFAAHRTPYSFHTRQLIIVTHQNSHHPVQVGQTNFRNILSTLKISFSQNRPKLKRELNASPRIPLPKTLATSTDIFKI